jgi:hypothetical protein
VAFGSTPPQFPIRGHFFWDGTTLYMWDGVEWQDIGPTAPSAGGGGITDAPMDGQSYVRKNGTWVPLPSGYVKNIVTSYYMSSQTILIPAGATEGLVVMWGSTGGSGGVTNADSQGTGAGGYLEKMLTGLVPGNTLVFTLGAAGAAGAIAGNGGNAGTTTLTSGTQTIGTLTCNGSAGGGANYGTGETLGGTATGGDVNIQGQAGSVGTTANYGEGSAGMTFYSQGANGVTFQAGSGPGMPGNPGGLKITWVITG